jgi:hypothetical protein
MSLKQRIKKQRLMHPAVEAELVLPGEPMIYSIKYPIGNRSRASQYFRNMKWKSLLKCFFKSYYRTITPVVVIVHFFVTPPESIKISPKELSKEATPAVFAYELCDYLLSFLEMLHHVLINSYKQIVKVEVDKFYSNNPRTVFKFMKWDQYVQLQNNNSVLPETQVVSETKREEQSMVQPFEPGNAEDKRICEAISSGTTSDDTALTYWPASSDCSLSDTSPIEPTRKKTRTAKLPTAHKETRRRQSREVSE